MKYQDARLAYHLRFRYVAFNTAAADYALWYDVPLCRPSIIVLAHEILDILDAPSEDENAIKNCAFSMLSNGSTPWHRPKMTEHTHSIQSVSASRLRGIVDDLLTG